MYISRRAKTLTQFTNGKTNIKLMITQTAHILQGKLFMQSINKTLQLRSTGADKDHIVYIHRTNIT